MVCIFIEGIRNTHVSLTRPLVALGTVSLSIGTTLTRIVSVAVHNISAFDGCAVVPLFEFKVFDPNAT